MKASAAKCLLISNRLAIIDACEKALRTATACLFRFVLPKKQNDRLTGQ
jgi:hypothetical protein